MAHVFTLVGEPVGKARARFSRVSGTAYTPSKTRRYEDAIRKVARSEMGSLNPLSGAVRVRLRAVFSIPASWSQRKRDAALRGEIKPTKRPDLDNVEKAWLDALNGIAYLDDAQVVEKTSEKVYGLQALVVVSVEPLL